MVWSLIRWVSNSSKCPRYLLRECNFRDSSISEKFLKSISWAFRDNSIFWEAPDSPRYLQLFYCLLIHAFAFNLTRLCPSVSLYAAATDAHRSTHSSSHRGKSRRAATRSFIMRLLQRVTRWKMMLISRSTLRTPMFILPSAYRQSVGRSVSQSTTS